MGYKGETLEINLNKGGFTHDPLVDRIEPWNLINGSLNITLHQGGKRKRGGHTLVNATTLDSNAQIMGMYDFIQLDGTQNFITATKNGNVFQDFDATKINKSGTTYSTSNYFSFATMNDELFMADGVTQLQKWTGSGLMVDHADPPSNWTTKKPIQVVVHGSKLSQRLWILNDRNEIFASALNNGDALATGGLIFDGNSLTKLETKDGVRLTAIWEFGDTFLTFSNRHTYQLDDSDSSTANWGWKQAPYTGGAAHWRVIVETDNDLYVMTDDMQIYSISTVNFSQDYKKQSILRPAFVDKWLRETVDITQIQEFHGEWDPVERAINWWFVRVGETCPDIYIPYYVDRPAIAAWGSPYRNDNGDSACKGSSSVLVKVADGDYRQRVGDHNGFVWDINQDTKTDNSSQFDYMQKIPLIDVGDGRVTKKFKRLWVTGIALSAGSTLKITWAVDGVAQTPITETLINLGIKWGDSDAVWGSFVWQESTLSEAVFDLGGVVGKRLSILLQDTVSGDDTHLTNLHLDYEVTTKKSSLR
tara:strand:- start:2178 stop:3773 length:1596 start_codon:yes stop_codon:yes gene_type:complete